MSLPDSPAGTSQLEDTTTAPIVHTPLPEDLSVSRTAIDTGWQFQEVRRTDVPDHRQLPWLPADVPGNIHLDLLRAGVIPQPFDRFHERCVEWVDKADWVYETAFTVLSPMPLHPYLLFHGLDTVAEIRLNGQLIGISDNMFISHRFPAADAIKQGQNNLQVTFRSALLVGQGRQAAWDAAGNPTMREQWDNWSARSFVRKAQYMYGWDWGPVLLSCGIWRKAELVDVPCAELGDWKYEYDLLEDGKVDVRATVTVNRTESGDPLRLQLNVQGELGVVHWEAQVPAAAGIHQVALPEMRLDAQVWQPSGVGDAIRYPLHIVLQTDDHDMIDEIKASIGFRKVELIQELDSDGNGRSFKFRVNGNDTFVKGANWIPNDSFPSRISESSLRQRVTQAADAGFNMLRVWGGGLYESEDFYNICDELGIMVWQDFAYGCAYYPDTGEYGSGDYGDQARIEASAAVKRIRNHPSLALWCGNNENHTMYVDGWGGTRPPRYLGEKIYDEILPSVIQEEDPGTPYWASSPDGGPLPNSADFGDCHNWDVWHGRGDWIHYTENDSRFCSEFGFAASCGMAAWDSVLAPSDRSARSPAVIWHDKTRKGYDTYLNYVTIHFPDPVSLEDLVYYTQINQAEAMKYGVEHYRRRKGRCWGTLIWQLNDCWPVQSWSMIDSTGEPKASYFAGKRFYAPLLLSLYKRDDDVEVHVVNDRLTPREGLLTVALLDFTGRVILEDSKTISVAANAAALVFAFDLAAAPEFDRESVFIRATFAPNDCLDRAENVLLLAEPKDLKLPAASVHVKRSRAASGKVELSLTSERFAPYVWLRSEDNADLHASDNFFHLLPNVAHTVLISEYEANVVIRTLADSVNR